MSACTKTLTPYAAITLMITLVGACTHDTGGADDSESASALRCFEAPRGPTADPLSPGGRDFDFDRTGSEGSVLGGKEPKGKRGEPEPEATCEDTTADPNNCGACGNVCSSGLCYAGVCADAVAGHVFAIGHGYGSSNPALDRALGNAIFVNERESLRVLAYAGGAPAALVAGTDAAIERAAGALGRTWDKTTATGSSSVAVDLPNADVFVVYAQPQATDAYLLALGDEWSLPLDDFARRGGIIVVLDTPSANAGTAQVLAPSGLLALGARTIAPGGVAYVGAAEDIGAARVPLMFGLADSVGWAPSTWTNLATSETGHSVIVHRAIY